MIIHQSGKSSACIRWKLFDFFNQLICQTKLLQHELFSSGTTRGKISHGIYDINEMSWKNCKKVLYRDSLMFGIPFHRKKRKLFLLKYNICLNQKESYSSSLLGKSDHFSLGPVIAKVNYVVIAAIFLMCLKEMSAIHDR